jgi:hypothetical protein
MFFEFVGAIFAYLFARAMWNFVVARAAACRQLPLMWLLQTTGLLIAFFCVTVLPIGIVIWAISVIH